MYGKTLGPPSVRSSVPATARIWSRMISASSRCRGMRQKQPVLGIDRDVGGDVAARHLVGLRGHHQPVHRLHAPAALDELERQPVEQLRMRRRLAHLAEVARRADDAFAEMMLPDPVHHHARGQRIVRATRATRRSRGGASSIWRPAAAPGTRVRFSDATDSTPGVISDALGVDAAAVQEVRRSRARARLRRSRAPSRNGCGFCLSSAAICCFELARAAAARPRGISATMSFSVILARSESLCSVFSICATLSRWPSVRSFGRRLPRDLQVLGQLRDLASDELLQVRRFEVASSPVCSGF